MKKILPDLITIDSSLAIPIYKQIVECIFKAIENGLLIQNDILPSVNSIAGRFGLARGSVFSAYHELRAAGIIDSIPGKGYFITSTRVRQIQNIFLLFNTFTPYKDTLYNSIVQHLPPGSRIDIYFHHHNKVLFEGLIREEASYYNHFIIMPEIYEHTLSVLSELDSKQVYLLDVGYKEYKKHYPGIFQNFDKDIFTVLTKMKQLVSKYKRLFLVVPRNFYNKEIISGFNRFGKTDVIETAVIHDLGSVNIQKRDAFIIVEDDHLVELVKCVKAQNWTAGKDIGLLSYNETSLKSVVGDGISTLTSDYAAMGKSVAGMLLSNERRVIENPCMMIDRQSF